MSSSVTGAVEAISVKNNKADGTRLRSPLYSIKLPDGWYNCGFNNPQVQKGQVVYFMFNEDKFGKQVDTSTIEVIEQAAAQSGGSAAPASADNRQNSIIYQSSRKDALEFAKLVHAAGGLVVPAKKDILGVLEAFVEEYTDKFAYAALNPNIRNPIEVPVDMGAVDE